MFQNFFKKPAGQSPLLPRFIAQSANKHSYPFYIKAPLVLLGIYLAFNILLLLQDILVPVCFAMLLAILLNRLVNFLTARKIPRVLAISIAVLTMILIFIAVITFLSTQIASFGELSPQFAKRGSQILNDVQQWIRKTFNLSLQKQAGILSDAADQAKSYIGSFLTTVTSILSTFILLPIYVFLLLYYKPLFINFFYEVFGYKHGNKVSEVLSETKSAIQSYISGLLIEMCIVAALNSTALLIIGVKYAVLLGIIGAILNLIPYIGGLIAIILPVAISLVTSDPINYTQPLVIIGAYILIQFIDNNVIVPRVVSSKVEVNALISIIVVLLGGALWGVSGMFLSIPFAAILKIIFDRVEELKPWGMLLGTTMNDQFTLSDIGTADANEKSVLSENEDANANEQAKEETS